MKKTLYCLLLGAALATTSCSDDMDEKHENPDAFTKTKIEYLFSYGAMKTIAMDYGDNWNYNFRLLGTIIQTTSRQEGKDRMNVYQKITDDKRRWENYYVTRMSTLTEIDKIYAQMSPEEQKQYRKYIEASKVLKAYNTSMATDFFGNMPYSEAFTARNPIYGGSVIFRPKYDKQKDIYYSILNDLKEAAEFFKTDANDDTFKRQDILFNGNCEHWRKFANSLRLKYAMRISNADEAKAKEVLGELNLADLITTNEDNAYLKVSGQETAPDGFWLALLESHRIENGYYVYAPELMTNLMKEADDPRLEVFFQPGTDAEGNVVNPEQEIIPYPSSADDAIELLNKTSDKNKLSEIYATYNNTTFRKNYYLPVGIAMTAAETYYCLAEAAHRNMISGNAEEFYNKGIALSVQQYYDFYKNSTASSVNEQLAKTDVSDATVMNWLNNSSFKFNASKALEQIATQKWMHMNILQIWDNWSEYRRTDYPVLLEDRENGALLNKENSPVRFMYPSSEASMNKDNYEAEAENNSPYAHLWWDVK